MKRLTRKQAAIVQARVLDPHASQRELGVKLGTSRSSVAKELAKPHVKAEIAALMDESPKLRLGALLRKLEAGLESTEVRSLRVVGEEFKVEAEVEDQSVRHKFLETAFKLRGALSPDAADAAPSGPINIAIIMAGGGTDAEKRAVADALVAARLSRGLHPLHNRDLTPEEAKAYRRTP